MNLLEVIILSIVQGMTEFLPVSSSGHLVVVDAMLAAAGMQKAEQLVEVSIVLHVGTLLAVLIFYRRIIFRLLTTDRRVIPLLFVGTLPAAVVGIGIKKLLPESTQSAILENVLLAGFMFPVTAALLVWSSRRKVGETPYQNLTLGSALAIGMFQALAILPGISRSGSTIAAGLMCGMRRDASAAFAFLLAIPAIGGAGLLETLDMLDAGGSATPPLTLLMGLVVSMLVGLLSLWWLIKLVELGRLGQFAWWLVPLGVAVVTWQLC